MNVSLRSNLIKAQRKNIPKHLKSKASRFIKPAVSIFQGRVCRLFLEKCQSAWQWNVVRYVFNFSDHLKLTFQLPIGYFLELHGKQDYTSNAQTYRSISYKLVKKSSFGSSERHSMMYKIFVFYRSSWNYENDAEDDKSGCQGSDIGLFNEWGIVSLEEHVADIWEHANECVDFLASYL